MKADDVERVEEIAELKVRQYFDHFLEKTLPGILYTHEHGCCTKKLLRKVLWVLLGIGIGLGVVFPEILKLAGQLAAL